MSEEELEKAQKDLAHFKSLEWASGQWAQVVATMYTISAVSQTLLTPDMLLKATIIMISVYVSCLAFRKLKEITNKWKR